MTDTQAPRQSQGSQGPSCLLARDVIRLYLPVPSLADDQRRTLASLASHLPLRHAAELAPLEVAGLRLLLEEEVPLAAVPPRLAAPAAAGSGRMRLAETPEMTWGDDEPPASVAGSLARALEPRTVSSEALVAQQADLETPAPIARQSAALRDKCERRATALPLECPLFPPEESEQRVALFAALGQRRLPALSSLTGTPAADISSELGIVVIRPSKRGAGSVVPLRSIERPEQQDDEQDAGCTARGLFESAAPLSAGPSQAEWRPQCGVISDVASRVREEVMSTHGSADRCLEALHELGERSVREISKRSEWLAKDTSFKALSLQSLDGIIDRLRTARNPTATACVCAIVRLRVLAEARTALSLGGLSACWTALQSNLANPAISKHLSGSLDELASLAARCAGEVDAGIVADHPFLEAAAAFVRSERPVLVVCDSRAVESLREQLAGLRDVDARVLEPGCNVASTIRDRSAAEPALEGANVVIATGGLRDEYVALLLGKNFHVVRRERWRVKGCVVLDGFSCCAVVDMGQLRHVPRLVEMLAPVFDTCWFVVDVSTQGDASDADILEDSTAIALHVHSCSEISRALGMNAVWRYALSPLEVVSIIEAACRFRRQSAPAQWTSRAWLLDIESKARIPYRMPTPFTAQLMLSEGSIVEILADPRPNGLLSAGMPRVPIPGSFEETLLDIERRIPSRLNYVLPDGASHGQTQLVWTRLCAECVTEVAVVHCADDAADLCAACDERLHSQSRVGSQHRRTPIQLTVPVERRRTRTPEETLGRITELFSYHGSDDEQTPPARMSAKRARMTPSLLAPRVEPTAHDRRRSRHPAVEVLVAALLPAIVHVFACPCLSYADIARAGAVCRVWWREATNSALATRFLPSTRAPHAAGVLTAGRGARDAVALDSLLRKWGCMSSRRIGRVDTSTVERHLCAVARKARGVAQSLSASSGLRVSLESAYNKRKERAGTAVGATLLDVAEAVAILRAEGVVDSAWGLFRVSVVLVPKGEPFSETHDDVLALKTLAYREIILIPGVRSLQRGCAERIAQVLRESMIDYFVLRETVGSREVPSNYEAQELVLRQTGIMVRSSYRNVLVVSEQRLWLEMILDPEKFWHLSGMHAFVMPWNVSISASGGCMCSRITCSVQADLTSGQHRDYVIPLP
eukprot:m51a1_g2634 hypothetical protein (1159) ;mRNA; r:575266-581590